MRRRSGAVARRRRRLTRRLTSYPRPTGGPCFDRRPARRQVPALLQPAAPVGRERGLAHPAAAPAPRPRRGPRRHVTRRVT